MTRSQQRLLAQLASSPNEVASGIGQCLEALRLISVLPRTSPVFVRYTSAGSPTIKAFGRDHLSRVPLRTVIALIKTSLSLSDRVRVTTALFYSEDGTIDRTPALVDEDSWKELAPYVHTLHVEDDGDDDDRSSTAASSLSSFSSISATTVVGSNSGNGFVSLSSSGVAAAPALGTTRGSGLNSSASAFVPSSNGITVKTSDGGKLVHLQDTRTPSALSPSSPQATSPFAILDSTGGCL